MKSDQIERIRVSSSLSISGPKTVPTFRDHAPVRALDQHLRLAPCSAHCAKAPKSEMRGAISERSASVEKASGPTQGCR